MTGSCHRCGSCCSSIPLLIKGMSPDYLKYLRTRGLKEDQGFILIPHDCQHLKALHWIPNIGMKKIEKDVPFTCDIHDSPDRPACCVKYHGQKIIKKMIIYRPPGCGYLEDKV